MPIACRFCKEPTPAMVLIPRFFPETLSVNAIRALEDARAEYVGACTQHMLNRPRDYALAHLPVVSLIPAAE